MAAVVELATAYISLSVSTGEVKKQIKTAMTEATSGGKAAGAKLGTEMADGIRGKLAEKSWVRNALQNASTGAGQNSARKFFDEFRTTSERVGAITGLVIGKTLSAGIRGGIAVGNIASSIFDKMKIAGVKMAKSVGSMIGSTFAMTIRGAVAGLGIGGGGLIAGVLFKGFDRMKVMDTARNKLAALNEASKRFGKTGVDIGKTIQDVTDTVTGTPFDLADSFDVAVNAIGGGVEDIKKYMTAVADAAAVANRPIAEMGDVFQEVVNKGYLTGETLSQLDSRFPATSWIRESVQRTSQDFDKLLEDGNITLEMLEKAIEEHAPELAKKLGNTLEGAISKVQSSMARLGADFLASIFGGATGDPAEGLKNSLNRVTEQFDRLDQWVVNHKDDIRNFFTSAKNAAGEVVNALRNIGGFLKEHPGLIQGVVAAFAAWKTIQGVAALSTALTAISTALSVTLPGAAAVGAAGISTALLGITVPAIIAWLLKDNPTFGNKGTVGNGGGIVPPVFGNGPFGIFGPHTANGVLPNAPGMSNGSTPTIGGIPIPGLGAGTGSTASSGGGLLGGAFSTTSTGGMAGTPGQGYPLPNNSGGLLGAGFNTLDRFASSQFGLSMTSGYRDPNGPAIFGVAANQSYHGSGRAHDYSGTPAQMLAFANFMADNFGGQLKELIFDHPAFGRTIKDGKVVGRFGQFYTMSQAGPHSDHVHVAFASGGGVSGPGTATSDSIPAWLSNGEHVLTADDVQAMGGQGAVYQFRNALHRSVGGEIPDALVPFDPGRVDKSGKDAGNIPPVKPGPHPYPGVIGYPDWGTPGTVFGPPPEGWWGKPINPDDRLFPDSMPPGLRDWWLDQIRRRRWKPLGYKVGGQAGGKFKQTTSDFTPGINDNDAQMQRPSWADITAQRDTLSGIYNPDIPGHITAPHTPPTDVPSAGEGLADSPGNFNPNMVIDTSRVTLNDTWMPISPIVSPGNMAPVGKAGSLTRLFPADIMDPLWQARLRNTDWSMTQIPRPESVRLDPELSKFVYGDPKADDPEDSRNKLNDTLWQEWWTSAAGKEYLMTIATGKFNVGGAIDEELLKQQGIDPNTTIHGQAQGAIPGPVDPNTTVHGQSMGAAPGPQQQDQPQQDQTLTGWGSDRTAGFVPVAAGNTGVAGTSSLAGFISMGSDIVGGLIDTGASLAQTAVTAAAAAGSGGAGAAAAPAASYGIQLGASIAKRASAFGFQLAGIGADALIAQLFPFGAPRALGYDYTQFIPDVAKTAPVTSLEKMGREAINKHFGLNADGSKPDPMSPESPDQPVPASTPNASLAPTAAAPPGMPPQTDVVPPTNPDPLWMLPPQMARGGQVSIYDQGGVLKPGDLALNASRRPEKVLTDKQWDALSKIQPVGRDAPLVKIDAIYGLSPQDVAAQIESKQKLAMMRYSGRP